MRGDLIGRLGGQQVVDISRGVADQLALLVDFKLIQTDIGDFVCQILVHFLQARQGLLLLIKNLGQQQTALEHVDLLIQGLVTLGDVVQLLLGLQVLLGHLVKAVGAAQQVVREFEVDRAFGRQQAAAAGLFRLDGLLGHGLLRLGQALLIDQGLQVLDFLVLARGFFQQQVVLAAAQILQQAVASQFLAAQGNQCVKRGGFGVELVALIGGKQLAIVASCFQGGVDLLDTGLAIADLGLSPLGSGLRGNALAVGDSQGFLQLALLRGAFRQQLFQLLHGQLAVALGYGYGFAGLDFGQFALVFGSLARGIVDLLFDVVQALFVIGFAVEQGQGLLEHRLQGFLVGVRQFALGNFVQALLHRFGGRRVGSLKRADTKAQAEQDGGDERAQSWHRYRSDKGGKLEFRGTAPGPVHFLRGI